jgi:hypothetical protein
MRQHGPRRIALDLRGLIGLHAIFRLAGGAKRDPAVDIWLTDGPIELRSIAQQWFVRMRQCGDDVRELMHDGCPVACVEDAPFAYVNSFLQDLIDAAYLDIKARLGGEPSSR